MTYRSLALAGALSLAVLTGCSAGDTAGPRNPSPTEGTARTAVVVDDPVPHIDALGPAWVTSNAAPAALSVCGNPVVTKGAAETAVATDPDGLTVTVSFIKVDDSSAATRHTTETLDGCSSTLKPGRMTLAWTTPSGEFKSGTTGYVLPMNPGSGQELAGGGAVAVAPANSDTIVAVVVAPGAGNLLSNERLQGYADLIAANQVAANSDVEPEEVPLVASVPELLPQVSEPDDELPTGPTTPEATDWTPPADPWGDEESTPAP